MLKRVTPEEEGKRQARLAELSTSKSCEDQLCAILMDCDIGGFGLHEEIARKKARGIIDHLERA